MTSETTDDAEWPTHCPLCGTELQSNIVDSKVTNDWDAGAPVTVLAEDTCPNPDCPGKDSDLAQAVGPDGAQS